MAQIQFFANVASNSINDTPNLIDTTVSGIGFYGSDHGVAVAIGAQQSTTFLTDKDSGTDKGLQLNNTAKASDTEVLLNNSNVPLSLGNLPNYQCPLNIRFTHTPEAVRVQNCRLRIFNRLDIGVSANGVTTHIFEARHPNGTQNEGLSLSHRAPDAVSTEFNWTTFLGYDPDSGDDTDESGGVDMLLTESPGAYGKNELEDTNSTTELQTLYNIESNEGAAHTSNQHDWYLAISSEPESIGSKTDYGLYFSCEYL